MTLLEAGFPFADVTRLVAADRRSVDPAYQAHRWWARRPPALIRAALLAANMPATTRLDEFWAAYADPAPHLAGMSVLDPFLGGGTTLVEAARLGADTMGTDVDPLAVMISEHQLDPAAPADVTKHGQEMLAALTGLIGRFWPAVTDDDDTTWHPLHYFHLARVECTRCEHKDHLYRALVIARSVGHAGSVVRTADVTAFCPDCLSLHDLDRDATHVTCCGQNHPLDAATYRGSRYTCRACGQRASHEDLSTGVAQRTLLAVEDTPAGEDRHVHRRIRAPRPSDKAARTKAAKYAADHADPAVLSRALVATENDRRPLSYGLRTVEDLHTARQQVYLTAALRWLADSDLDEQAERALRLAVSTTITSNNRLCGYATDYGRLAPLFSVRAFALPWLTVELNPLNPTGGRGTLTAALNRVANSGKDQVKRSTITSRGETKAVEMTLPRETATSLTCQDSTSTNTTVTALADMCLTDPPYFDFIPYDTLSQVFRAWHDGHDLAGTPLLPDGDDKVTAFGTRLGAALASAVKNTRPDGLVAFTYKGNDDAWDAVGIALDEAKLRVTAMWPVLADPHMGHHASAGNCEYDILVVARPVTHTQNVAAEFDADGLLATLRAVRKVSLADAVNIASALRVGHQRWAAPTG